MAGTCVLVAPLDWGLGHATRCIPIIRELLRQGAAVMLGGSGGSLIVLRDEFPDLPVLELPPYGVRYGKGTQQIPTILRQVPRLARVIQQEHGVLESAIRRYRIKAIVSDNRYGLWSPEVPTAIVCHQLRIQLPGLMRWGEWPLAHAHNQFLKRFQLCWIPDYSDSSTLSGKLTKPVASSMEMRFIGPLSRFVNRKQDSDGFSYSELNSHIPEVAAVLSGPEPQRTILEELLTRQAHEWGKEMWIVKGDAQRRSIESLGNLTKISFMRTEDLHRLYLLAPIIVSRPGYSSLMDYAALGLKQMALIPTPGQTEQEYLAKRLQEQHIAPWYRQADFRLEAALSEVPAYSGFNSSNKSQNQLRIAVRELLAMA